MTKRKEERRELLKDDEFHTLLEQWALKIKEEPKKYIGGMVGAFALLALIFGYLNHAQKTQLNQAATLFEAEKILATNLDDPSADYQFKTQNEKLEAALVEIDKVLPNSSGATAAQAKALKIKVLIDLGKEDGLEKLYQDLAKSTGNFRIQGLTGLGDYYAAKGRYEDALAQYNALAKGQGGNPDLEEFAKLKMAECYEAKGDIEAAKRELTELIARYPEDDDDAPPVIALAKTKLEEIK